MGPQGVSNELIDELFYKVDLDGQCPTPSRTPLVHSSALYLVPSVILQAVFKPHASRIYHPRTRSTTHLHSLFPRRLPVPAPRAAMNPALLYLVLLPHAATPCCAGNGHLTIEEVNHFLCHGCKARPTGSTALGPDQALRLELLNEAGPRRGRSVSMPMRRPRVVGAPATSVTGYTWAITPSTPGVAPGTPRPMHSPRQPHKTGAGSNLTPAPPSAPISPHNFRRAGFGKLDKRLGSVDISDEARDASPAAVRGPRADHAGIAQVYGGGEFGSSLPCRCCARQLSGSRSRCPKRASCATQRCTPTTMCTRRTEAASTVSRLACGYEHECTGVIRGLGTHQGSGQSIGRQRPPARLCGHGTSR